MWPLNVTQIGSVLKRKMLSRKLNTKTGIQKKTFHTSAASMASDFNNVTAKRLCLVSGTEGCGNRRLFYMNSNCSGQLFRLSQVSEIAIRMLGRCSHPASKSLVLMPGSQSGLLPVQIQGREQHRWLRWSGARLLPQLWQPFEQWNHGR